MLGVIICVCDGTCHRWLRESHPLADHLARIKLIRACYRRNRGNVAEAIEIITGVLAEEARATSPGEQESPLEVRIQAAIHG
jgi:hypothetical protein